MKTSSWILLLCAWVLSCSFGCGGGEPPCCDEPTQAPPEIIEVYQSTVNAPAKGAVTLRVTVREQPGDSLRFAWASSKGVLGSPVDTASTSEIVWTAPGCSAATTPFLVQVTVTNSWELSASRNFQIWVPTPCQWSTPSEGTTAFREGHTLSVLRSGQMLLVGGGFNSAELYDEATHSWSPTGSMAVSRKRHTASVLPSGEVLVTGGHERDTTLASAEVYDPASGSWAPVASMAEARYGHTATVLPSGKVLVAGGGPVVGPLIASAEVYDPAKGSWAPVASMASSRRFHTATLLPSGKVLVVGGASDRGALATAEVYDPDTGTWAPTPSRTFASRFHTATVLPSGKVLVTGGDDISGDMAHGTALAEIYDPADNSWRAMPRMLEPRTGQTASLLPSGMVLITGGRQPAGRLASTEVYDPAANSWKALGNLVSPRFLACADVLPSGKVLVTGGAMIAAHPQAEVFNPAPDQ